MPLMIRLYALACVAGAAAPLAFLAAFLVDEGVDPRAFLDQVAASDLSLMAWADVVVAGLVVVALAVVEGRRGLRRWWAPVAATAVVGPSLGLPLLLLLREQGSRDLARASANP